MIRIRDSFDKYSKGTMKKGNFSILKNPTIYELKDLRKEEGEHNVNITTSARGSNVGFYLRANLMGENLYAWYGDYAGHTDIAVVFGLTTMDDILGLILYTNENCEVEEINYSISSGDRYRSKSVILPIIKKCKSIMNICASNVKMTLSPDY
jgi:hypothetical protein